MADDVERQTALGDLAARPLATATKTVPQLARVTPRWLMHVLQWVSIEAGIYRVNRVKNEANIAVDASSGDERALPRTFAEYQEQPREYVLSAITTMVEVHTRISDLYSVPHNQINEQLRLTTEIAKERQEDELVNNPEFGLLHNVAARQILKSRKGPPAPDDLDELLASVWKEPGFFLAHPTAIAAFGRECTRRGVPPPTVTCSGSPFVTWRGVPLVPSDKVAIQDGKTKILLVRTGERNQGVVGLYKPNLPGQQSPGLSVRLAGINKKAIASYLVSLYCSLAVLTEDALGVLEDVDTVHYHNYK